MVALSCGTPQLWYPSVVVPLSCGTPQLCYPSVVAALSCGTPQLWYPLGWSLGAFAIPFRVLNWKKKWQEIRSLKSYDFVVRLGFSVQSHGLTTRRSNLTINRGKSWKDKFFLYYILFDLLKWSFLLQFCANPLLNLTNQAVPFFICLFTGNTIPNRLLFMTIFQIRSSLPVSCILIAFSKWQKLLFNLMNIYHTKREVRLVLSAGQSISRFVYISLQVFCVLRFRGLGDNVLFGYCFLHFQPRPQNRILVLPRVFFPNFRQALVLLIWETPLCHGVVVKDPNWLETDPFLSYEECM